MKTCIVDNVVYELNTATSSCGDCVADGDPILCTMLDKCEPSDASGVWVKVGVTFVSDVLFKYNVDMIAAGMGIAQSYFHAFHLGFEDGYENDDEPAKYALPDEQKAYDAGVKVGAILAGWYPKVGRHEYRNGEPTEWSDSFVCTQCSKTVTYAAEDAMTAKKATAEDTSECKS